MIWLVGCNGMLGKELGEALSAARLDYVGTDREVDITDPEAITAFGKGKRISAVINCAAYTAVDKAEDDVDLCAKINTEGPANLAHFAKTASCLFIHFSTDYVFHGDGTRPYREDDPTDPTGVYGLTKRDGETRALAAHKATYIIRTAWLYGQHGNNFVHTMLKLMNDKESLKVVNDQRGTPTWAADLSGAIVTLINAHDTAESVPYGIYHYTNAGETTWFEFASEIYRQGRELGLITGNCSVLPCTSSEFPAKVKRPAYSVLDKSKIQIIQGIEVPDWKESLAKFLDEKIKGAR